MSSANCRHELQRLATYSDWPTEVGLKSPLTLARLGHVYTGSDSVTFCCQCKAEVSGWRSGDDPALKHPSCSSSSLESDDVATVIRRLQPLMRKHGDDTESSPTARRSADVRNSGSATVETSPVVTFSDTCRNLLRRVGSKDLSLPVLSSSNTDRQSLIDRVNPDCELLKDESVRLSTFHDWPERAACIVKPRDLAKAGMFYTGQSDRVQCAFCGGCLRNWVQGDRPDEEHRKHFPECSFDEIVHKQASAV